MGPRLCGMRKDHPLTPSPANIRMYLQCCVQNCFAVRCFAKQAEKHNVVEFACENGR